MHIMEQLELAITCKHGGWGVASLLWQMGNMFGFMLLSSLLLGSGVAPHFPRFLPEAMAIATLLSIFFFVILLFDLIIGVRDQNHNQSIHILSISLLYFIPSDIVNNFTQ